MPPMILHATMNTVSTSSPRPVNAKDELGACMCLLEQY